MAQPARPRPRPHRRARLADGADQDRTHPFALPAPSLGAPRVQGRLRLGRRRPHAMRSRGSTRGPCGGSGEVQHALAQGARGREVYEGEGEVGRAACAREVRAFEHAAEAEVGNAFVY